MDSDGLIWVVTVNHSADAESRSTEIQQKADSKPSSFQIIHDLRFMCTADCGKCLQLKQQAISNNEITAILADILASISNSDALLAFVRNLASSNSTASAPS